MGRILRIMRNHSLHLAVLFTLPFALAYKPWGPGNYPNPTKDVDKCGRKGVQSWICDPDNVIEYESANVVEGILKEIEAGKKPYTLAPCGSAGMKGFQVAVALMRKMRYSGDANTAAQEFARALHDGWGVGDRRCNNGVLLFLSVEDRQLYISTGSGATSRLTYDVLGSIIEDVRPALRDTRYEDAVERAVVDIGLALAGRKIEPEHTTFGKDDAIGLLVFASAIGGFLFFAGRSESRKRKRYNDCKSKLEKLKRDQAAMRANSYNPTSCPVCLEDFTDANGTGTADASSGGGGTGSDNDAGKGSGSGRGLDESRSPRGGKEVEAELKEPLMPAGSAGSGGGGPGVGFEVSGPPAAAAAAAPAGPGFATGAAAAAGAAGAAAPASRLPLVLPCGHAFCEPCITRWLEQKKVTCPICRRPFDEEDAADPRDTPAPRMPRPNPNDSTTNPNPNANPNSSGGPSSSNPRPPCSAEYESDTYQDEPSAPAYASAPRWGAGAGASSSTPRLRLRWGGRRRMMPLQEDMLMAEMLFRLRQLQRQHPEYISSGMLHSWEQDLQNGREFSVQQLREFQLRDPATRQALAHSGSSGTSLRFGGGGSGGGGGRGGSW